MRAEPALDNQFDLGEINSIVEKAIQSLPPQSLEEYEKMVSDGLRIGLEQVERGETYTTEQVKQMLGQWIM